MRVELPSGTAASRELIAGATRGLVVIPDVMGLRPLFDDLVRQRATEWGMSTCCAELYPGLEHLDLEGRLAAAADLDDARVLADVVAAADATGCDRVGLIGFCMGGMYTIKAVGLGRFESHVAFYGMIRVPEPWRGAGQAQPLSALAAGDASRLLAIVGTDDPYTPAADVADLAAAGASVVSYDGAEHGFVHDADRPAHRPDDARDAWRRAHEWLTR